MAKHHPDPPRGNPKPGDWVQCGHCGCSVMTIKEAELLGARWDDKLMIRDGRIRTILECAKCGQPMKISERYRNSKRVF